MTLSCTDIKKSITNTVKFGVIQAYYNASGRFYSKIKPEDGFELEKGS